MNAKMACRGLSQRWINAQVPANGARGGHPRTVPHPKMSSKGRTELQISLSGAKNAEEVAGDVQKFVAPQKTGKNIEKLHEIFEKIKKHFFLMFCEFFLAESIRMYPNVSECVKTGPNRPENVEKLRENVEKLRKNLFLTKIAHKRH